MRKLRAPLSRLPDGIDPSLWTMVRQTEPDHAAALSYYPEPLKAPAVTLMALTVELRSIPAKVSEPMLGAIRLQWWREALSEAYEGASLRAHPLAQALAHLRPYEGLRAPIEQMIDDTAYFLEEAPQTGAEVALRAAHIHDGQLLYLLGLLVAEPQEGLSRLGALYGVARSMLTFKGQSFSQSTVEPPMVRIARQGGAEGPSMHLTLLGEFHALWHANAPVPAALTPVLAPIKLTRKYLKASAPSEMARHVDIFWTVLRGK